MSVRQSSGSWLKDTAAVPFDVGPQPRPLYGFGQKIHSASQDLPQAQLDAGEADQADMRLGIEFGEEVDVTVRAGFAACGRTKHREVANTGRPQLRRVRKQGGDDRFDAAVVGCGHVFGCLYERAWRNTYGSLAHLGSAQTP